MAQACNKKICALLVEKKEAVNRMTQARNSNLRDETVHFELFGKAGGHVYCLRFMVYKQ
jgi:hypothetical protein